MITFDTLLSQTLSIRQRATDLLRSIPTEQADVVPPTWKNNARWHAGHMIVTPRLLTYNLMGKPLGVPDEYRKWFAKGSGPEAWNGEPVPGYEELISQLIPASEKLFGDLKDQLATPFAQPYKTSAGTVLNSLAESLNFSLMHDGIHVGMLLALRRNLALH